MSTTAVSAGQIMDRAANLLNDPNKTDYTYTVMLPYLNMAIEEFADAASEANTPFSNLTSHNWTATPIVIPAGGSFLTAPEDLTPGYIHYPDDLIEVQGIKERPQGSMGSFNHLPRREFPEIFPPTNSLLYWIWERGVIRFNPANIAIEVVLHYVYQGISYAVSENSMVTFIGSRTYLAYKTAAFCAMFIGENENRAKVLENRAEEALDRTINISNKGRQQITTRHRPFRAAYKARGGY